MNVGLFEQRNEARWREFEELVDMLERGKEHPLAPELPRRFREVCADLALAQSRLYGLRLIERLNELVIRGNKQLQRARTGTFSRMVRFVAADFPALVRQEWRLFWLCNALFWIPFFLLLFSIHHDVSWVQSLLGAEGMQGMEQMYGGESQQLSHLRGKYGSNFMMFCHYINNNIGIDFRIFAGGILMGVGTIFFLLFNGLHIGAAAGYVQYACNPWSFWTFVAGHSSFELLGMVVAGMAGLRMGMGLLKPGRLTRSRALKESAARALPLIYGAGVMTFLAAIIEGFWSAQDLPGELKIGVGLTFWVLFAVYFLFAGRGSHAA